MSWQFTPYVLPLLAAAGITAMLSVSAWRHRERAGALPFAILMLAVFLWSIGNAGQIGSTTLAAKVLWANLQYVPITVVPAAWLCFALQYTGYMQWLKRCNMLLLCIEPVLVVALAFTNESHHLFRAQTNLQLQGSFLALDSHFAIGFWIHAVYSYLLLLIGNVILIRAHLHTSRLYRRQMLALLIGALAPWVGNALYLIGLSPVPNLDITPFAFTVTGLAMGWGVLRLQLLDVVPVARAAVIEGMQDGVIVLDDQNRVIDINPAAQQITGHTDAAIVGRPGREIFAARSDLVERYRETHKAQDELELTVDEVPRVYDLRISPLTDHQQNPLGRLIILRDITKERQAAEDRERLIAELDAFAHTVAHDLKTPLTAVIAAGKLLKARSFQDLPPDMQRTLNALVRNSNRMNNIVDELLLLASVRRVTEIEMGPLDTASIVEEALHRLAYLIRTHDAEVNVPDRWPQALGHAGWVEEVWVNYISNAIKYGGRPPQVELGADRVDSGVRFWVQDNGQGLSESAQAHLFTPFTRLEQVRAEGHGLGLSIVQRIVTRLDGQVGVESVVGEGSTFSFTLPAADA